uniref:Uncharacterized protein n=1 Tax=Timema tahoe TaxID=61484 RepID=A0A7R9IRB7_9NEOP|nr:unnamed protein product [Timema tahoe]
MYAGVDSGGGGVKGSVDPSVKRTSFSYTKTETEFELDEIKKNQKHCKVMGGRKLQIYGRGLRIVNSKKTAVKRLKEREITKGEIQDIHIHVTHHNFPHRREYIFVVTKHVLATVQRTLTLSSASFFFSSSWRIHSAFLLRASQLVGKLFLLSSSTTS